MFCETIHGQIQMSVDIFKCVLCHQEFFPPDKHIECMKRYTNDEFRAALFEVWEWYQSCRGELLDRE
jgi:hypothetical protein